MASEAERVERVEQQVTALLQQIDADFVRAAEVGAGMLHKVKAFSGHMRGVDRSLRVWARFFNSFGDGPAQTLCETRAESMMDLSATSHAADVSAVHDSAREPPETPVRGKAEAPDGTPAAGAAAAAASSARRKREEEAADRTVDLSLASHNASLPSMPSLSSPPISTPFLARHSPTSTRFITPLAVARYRDEDDEDAAAEAGDGEEGPSVVGALRFQLDDEANVSLSPMKTVTLLAAHVRAAADAEAPDVDMAAAAPGSPVGEAPGVAPASNDGAGLVPGGEHDAGAGAGDGGDDDNDDDDDDDDDGGAAPDAFELGAFPSVYRTGAGAAQLTAVFEALGSASAAPATVAELVARLPPAYGAERVQLLVDLLQSRRVVRRARQGDGAASRYQRTV